MRVRVYYLFYNILYLRTMNEYIVSARKYRPFVFDHVVGQTHVTTTLKNAIRREKVAQALLFCGPRGVGKTTCARVLAKAINCENITADVEPCNTCKSCTQFHNNHSLNIHEIDAASHNSVEDIRNLIEQIRYAPPLGKYKVYIIDEVHMLSHAAFNSFLKTLEEPPSYVIFILATTEKHKIIPTVLSRCQIFDFHSIAHQDIVHQLKVIAEQEKIACEEEALYLISQRAEGSLRDALSTFDLVATFSSQREVSLQDTRKHLHVLDHTYYFSLVSLCLKGDAQAALLLFDQILKLGFDGRHFLIGLGEHLRSLMVAKSPLAIQLIVTSKKVQQQYKVQAAQLKQDWLTQTLRIVHHASLHYGTSYHKRLHVELALVEITKLQVSDKPAPIVKTTVSTTQASPTNAEASPHHTHVASSHVKEETIIPHSLPKRTEALATKHAELKNTTKLPTIGQLKRRVKRIQESVPAPDSSVPKNVKQSFTLEDIQPHWRAYAEKLKAEGKMTEYSLLNQNFTVEDSTILISLINAIQQDTFSKMKEALVWYLKRKLACTHITLRSNLVAKPEDKPPYTAQEKSSFLMRKYPHLRTLQQRFGLTVQD